MSKCNAPMFTERLKPRYLLLREGMAAFGWQQRQQHASKACSRGEAAQAHGQQRHAKG